MITQDIDGNKVTFYEPLNIPVPPGLGIDIYACVVGSIGRHASISILAALILNVLSCLDEQTRRNPAMPEFDYQVESH
jgi:hypothetical protein